MGVSVRDDRLLLEFLILEGAMAGLRWATILKKRENYRKAFDGFDPARVARYGKKKQPRRNSHRNCEPSSLPSSVSQHSGLFCASLRHFGSIGTESTMFGRASSATRV